MELRFGQALSSTFIEQACDRFLLKFLIISGASIRFLLLLDEVFIHVVRH